MVVAPGLRHRTTVLLLSLAGACTVPKVDILMLSQDGGHPPPDGSAVQGDAVASGQDTGFLIPDTGPVDLGRTPGAWDANPARTDSSVSSCTEDCSKSGRVCLGGRCVAKPTDIAAGGNHTCVVTEGNVLCWGSNLYGELGIGKPSSRQTSPVAVTDLTNVKSLAAGADFTCALLKDGTVKCWGNNAAGQLGSSTVPTSSSPLLVPGLSGVETRAPGSTLVAGRDFACARTVEGKVWCWGNNGEGQLGRSTSTLLSACPPPVSAGAPAAVENLTTVATVAAGTNLACAVLNDGTAICWGGNRDGQLGLGDKNTSAQFTPAAVLGLGKATQLVATTKVSPSTCSATVCARLLSNTVSCWGDNSLDELGNQGAFILGEGHPVPVSLEYASDLAAGADFICSIVVDGQVKCWGNIVDGDGSTSEPTAVKGLNYAIKIAAGADHVCALIADGTAQCWGNNNMGQLGDGTVASSRLPVFVQ